MSTVKIELNDALQYKVLSLSPDISYLAYKGWVKLPKHVALGMTEKLYGLSQLTGVLNGLGHAISYSPVFELDTALAELQIANIDSGLTVDTFPKVFTTQV